MVDQMNVILMTTLPRYLIYPSLAKDSQKKNYTQKGRRLGFHWEEEGGEPDGEGEVLILQNGESDFSQTKGKHDYQKG